MIQNNSVKKGISRIYELQTFFPARDFKNLLAIQDRKRK